MRHAPSRLSADVEDFVRSSFVITGQENFTAELASCVQLLPSLNNLSAISWSEKEYESSTRSHFDEALTNQLVINHKKRASCAVWIVVRGAPEKFSVSFCTSQIWHCSF